VDFADTISRNMLLANNANLKGMIERGTIVLYIHPVFGLDAFSVIGAEAVAQAVHLNSLQAYDFMMRVLLYGAGLDGESVSEMADRIAEFANEADIPIVSEGIQTGTFVSWLSTISRSPYLHQASGFQLPLVVINNQIVDGQNINWNDTENVRRLIANFGN